MRNTKIKTPDDSVRGHVRVRQFILICVRGRSASAKNLADGRQSADTVRVRTTLNFRVHKKAFRAGTTSELKEACSQTI